MTLNDDATMAAYVVFVLFGIPYILVIGPAMIQGLLGGGWSIASTLLHQGWFLLCLGTRALKCLLLIVGAILE